MGRQRKGQKKIVGDEQQRNGNAEKHCRHHTGKEATAPSGNGVYVEVGRYVSAFMCMYEYIYIYNYLDTHQYIGSGAFWKKKRVGDE
eukprot:NODE_10015_length_299_cov_16.420000_g8247_i0.p1 GENE.NODE_10015_length_299_cov_16.420000_g8247_i0~~NODE_10015_length_299_cov_16.420000_g8247_i0.p1  ORF type:complete len:87 (+),score=13.12 NODE_10015_length_299_cov_16.420000_g8247_i0:19-279(+)